MELSRDCGYDIQCNLAKGLMGNLCDMFITKDDNNTDFCNTLRKVIAIRYDREKKLQSVGQLAAERYNEVKQKEKYKKMEPSKLKTRLQLLMDRSMEYYTKKFSTITPEEKVIQKAIDQHSGLLKDIAKGLSSDKKMRELYEEVRQRSKTSSWQYYANYIYEWVRSQFGWCTQNKLKCLALLTFIAAIIITMWFPTVVFSSVSTVLTNILGSFFYRLAGLTYKIAKITNSQKIQKAHRVANRGFLGATWDGLQGLGSGVVFAVKYPYKRITGSPLTKQNAVSFFDEALSLLPFIDGVVAPVLGNSASLKYVIKTALTWEKAYITANFAYNLGKCQNYKQSGASIDALKPCSTTIITFAGMVLRRYIQAKWGDQDADDSTILALTVEGQLLNEMFWAAVDFAAYKNMFPSFIGTQPHEQLKFVSYVRLGVRIADLFNTTRSLGPIWGAGKAVDMKISTTIVEKIFFQKALALGNHASGLWWKNDGDAFWTSETNYWGNKDALKKELDKDKEMLDKSKKDMKDKKDILTGAKAVCKAQLTILDGTTMDLMKGREDVFVQFAKQINLGKCNIKDQVKALYSNVDEEIVINHDETGSVCWKTLFDDKATRYKHYKSPKTQAYWVIQYFDKYTDWLAETIKYIGIIPKSHPIHREKSTADAKAGADAKSKKKKKKKLKSDVEKYYAELKERYDTFKGWLTTVKGLNSTIADKRHKAYESLKSQFVLEIQENGRIASGELENASAAAKEYIQKRKETLKERCLTYQKFEETALDNIAKIVEGDILEATAKAMEDTKAEEAELVTLASDKSEYKLKL